MLRSTTISTRSAISSLAKFTNKDEPARWLSGASSQPNGRLGLGLLRPTQPTSRYSDEAPEGLPSSASNPLPKGQTYRTDRALPKPDISSATDKSNLDGFQSSTTGLC